MLKRLLEMIAQLEIFLTVRPTLHPQNNLLLHRSQNVMFHLIQPMINLVSTYISILSVLHQIECTLS